MAIDLQNLEPVVRAIGRLAGAIVDAMPGCAAVLWAAQHGALHQETRDGQRTPSKFQYYLWDIGSICRRVSDSPDVTDPVRQAAHDAITALAPGGAILAEGHRGAWFDGIAGVTVYLMPPGQQRLSPLPCARLAFARDARWQELLATYHDYLG